jgi:hypothetical protein
MAALLLITGPAMAIEEPTFEVVRKEGAMEIRKYAPFIVAQTWVQGDMDEASSRGFRLIADYIFGNNVAVGERTAAKIAMTAPVTMAPEAASQKIAMTAPVTMAPQAAASAPGAAQRWRVHFVMPRQYTLASLPKPNNPEVQLEEVPTKWFAVLRYSGLNTNARVQQRNEEALAWVQAQKLTPLGAPQLARYDPPWTLPPFRRNEILVEIAAP